MLMHYYFKLIPYFEQLNLQLRKAIEDVNSGNLQPTHSREPVIVRQPSEPQKEPLLGNDNNDSNDHNKNVQNTVSSMNSSLSNSDNCSDIEMGNMARPNDTKK